MKNYAYILLVPQLFVITIAHAQFKPGDVGFNGKTYEIYKNAGVKTQTIQFIDTSFGGSQTVVSISEFTEAGWEYRTNYPTETELTEDEIAAGWTNTITDEYTYHPDGRIRIITLSGYDLVDIIFGFEYDNKNRLINSSVAAAEARQYTYEYDKEGNISSRSGKANMFQYDDEGNLMDEMAWVDYEHTIYTWNKKHELISETFNMRGEFYNKTDYVYNGKGQLTSYDVYYDTTPGEKPSYTTYLTYNNKGLISKMVREGEGMRMEYLYEYTYR